MDQYSDEEQENEILDYILIEFITRGRKSGKLIDAVPSSWVTYNEKKKKIYMSVSSRAIHKFTQTSEKESSSR